MGVLLSDLAWCASHRTRYPSCAATKGGAIGSHEGGLKVELVLKKARARECGRGAPVCLVHTHRDTHAESGVAEESRKCAECTRRWKKTSNVVRIELFFFSSFCYFNAGQIGSMCSDIRAGMVTHGLRTINKKIGLVLLNYGILKC